MGDPMYDHILKVRQRSMRLFLPEEVDRALDTLALTLHTLYYEKNPIFLAVMVGGLPLTAELLKRFDWPLQLDYVHATRYRGEVQGQEVQWKVRPSLSLQGRHVLVLDDVLDGGITLRALMEELQHQKPASLRSVVLVDKVDCRAPEGLAHADMVALNVERRRYLFGYGMDYKGYLRNAPGIFAVPDELL